MIELRPLTNGDVEAHIAGEDPEVIRWLSGVPSTDASTRRHFAVLAENASTGEGKRGFGIWCDDQLAGYIDFDPDAEDLPAAGDINIAYAVHPWARGQGVATSAVLLVCNYLAAEAAGKRAIIRADARNTASQGVAVRSGFRRIADAAPAGGYVLYARNLPLMCRPAVDPLTDTVLNAARQL